MRRFVERIMGFARVTLVDRVGSGLSDPFEPGGPPEEDAEDFLAVLDAAGAPRAAIRAATRRGTGENLGRLAPSLVGDAAAHAWLGRLERSSASPRAMRTLSASLLRVDVRELLPDLRVPTLVLLPSAGDPETLLGELEEFLTGSRTGRARERQLLTIAFTDVVGATALAARLGDAGWRELLRAHDEALRAVEPLGLQLRAGLHTGECERIGDDVGGMAVHIAARIAALAGPDEVLASGTTYGTVVGSGLSWEWRADEELKGVPGRWPIFRLAQA